MNDFARLHSGDEIFKRIMIGVSIGAIIFAIYVGTY